MNDTVPRELPEQCAQSARFVPRSVKPARSRRSGMFMENLAENKNAGRMPAVRSKKSPAGAGLFSFTLYFYCSILRGVIIRFAKIVFCNLFNNLTRISAFFPLDKNCQPPASGPFPSRKCGEERGDGGVVAEGFAEVGEAVHVAGAEDEAAAKLKRVLAQAVRAKAGGVGALASGFVLAPENMQQVSAAQSGSAIGLALRVHQERKGDAGLFAEKAGVVLVAEPDDGEARAFFLEGLLVFAQLRDVLAAEHSTIMPQKYEHRWALRPQRAELNRTVVRVGQDDARKLRAER